MGWGVGGGAPLVTRHWEGGHKTFFLPIVNSSIVRVKTHPVDLLD